MNPFDAPMAEIARHVPLPDRPVWRYEFYGLMRWLSAVRQDKPPVGEALRPQQETFRLGQKPSMAFAPREIADLRQDGGLLRIRLHGLGLLGPNGAMPLQFTDFIRDRAEAHQDTTLADFLDVFHHRHLSAMYRAWANSQAAAGLDRPQDERFSRYVDRLAGCEAGQPSVLPGHARLCAAAHLVREARNPAGMASTLSNFFGVPIEVEEFVPRWVRINDEDVTLLGAPGQASMLGDGAFAGEHILDCQHGFRLIIGPLSLEDYLSFTPTGHNLPLLVEWVRAFVGFEFAWEAELRIAPRAAPGARVGSEERLGWSTWLGEGDAETPTTGMIFDPEEAMTA
ncbi:type VI secretion system baseplate subunit TssG [Thauera sinica]|uniref:Type VI secretion system baseplate subunit TssG n=1 Tax=Thauera sinica TaxID=2665146 RepID=A0ABW1ATL8_9RHOO|nr:type VI secretion system baseplate subunit TssG [Thauera sp. K11]ATE59941.1 type VI secretion system baseplate subunit TssG [Thauera sp. K11]